MTGLIIVIAPLAGRLSDRLGSRWLLTGGMTLLAAQLLYFSRLGVHESFGRLVPGMLLGGFLNSSRQLGGSIGVALMGAIMVHEIGGRQTPGRSCTASRSPSRSAPRSPLPEGSSPSPHVDRAGPATAPPRLQLPTDPPASKAPAFAEGARPAASARSTGGSARAR